MPCSRGWWALHSTSCSSLAAAVPGPRRPGGHSAVRCGPVTLSQPQWRRTDSVAALRLGSKNAPAALPSGAEPAGDRRRERRDSSDGDVREDAPSAGQVTACGEGRPKALQGRGGEGSSASHLRPETKLAVQGSPRFSRLHCVLPHSAPGRFCLKKQLFCLTGEVHSWMPTHMGPDIFL